MHPQDDLELESNGSNYLVSVSDLMSGLVFVFIITLMTFVINFKEVNEQLSNSKSTRTDLLNTLKEELEKLDVLVEVHEEHGVLRLTEKAIRFGRGKAKLEPQELNNLNYISNVLARILPCYTNISNLPAECNPEIRGKLDSVFIEGHTDNTPIGKNLRFTYKDNWDLSAKRAILTYKSMLATQPQLKSMVNGLNQPIFSISGYGDGRPLNGHNHTRPTNDPANRRIDLRFIMTPPQAIDPINNLKTKGVS